MNSRSGSGSGAGGCGRCQFCRQAGDGAQPSDGDVHSGRYSSIGICQRALQAAVCALLRGRRIDDPSRALVVCTFLMLHEPLVALARRTFPKLGIVDVERAFDRTLDAFLELEPPRYLTFGRFDPRGRSVFRWRLQDEVSRRRTRLEREREAGRVHRTRFATPDEQEEFERTATAIRAAARKRLAGRRSHLYVLEAHLGPVFGRRAKRAEELARELNVRVNRIYKIQGEVQRVLVEVGADFRGAA